MPAAAAVGSGCGDSCWRSCRCHVNHTGPASKAAARKFVKYTMGSQQWRFVIRYESMQGHPELAELLPRPGDARSEDDRPAIRERHSTPMNFSHEHVKVRRGHVLPRALSADCSASAAKTQPVNCQEPLHPEPSKLKCLVLLLSYYLASSAVFRKKGLVMCGPQALLQSSQRACRCSVHGQVC